MLRAIARILLSIGFLYSSGYLTIEVLKKLEKAGKIKISMGMSPMTEFNRRLHRK